jgi:hypothetical protein
MVELPDSEEGVEIVDEELFEEVVRGVELPDPEQGSEEGDGIEEAI